MISAPFRASPLGMFLEAQMFPIIDPNLIKKYDRPGPRYTSYPTAPRFSDAVGAAQVCSAITHGNMAGSGLSLYAHIPFCHRLCWYCGCNMQVSRNNERMARHFHLLNQEIEAMAPEVDDNRLVRQIHLGGGSPNYMKPEQFAALMQTLTTPFNVASDAEISTEIDPRLLTMDHLRVMYENGVNRVSLGVQDFDPRVQKAVNRIQSFGEIATWFGHIRDTGIRSINMDLMYGLPHQSLETFNDTLNKTIQLDPDRIALFNFAYLPDLKPHMKLIHADTLPPAPIKLQMMTTAVQRLTEAGYLFIGMDHFAKPEDPLAKALQAGELHRNFQGYTTYPNLEMLGFGMSAISMQHRVYSQNLADTQAYEEAVSTGENPTFRGVILSDDDCFRRELINRLMCRFEIDTQWIQEETSQTLAQYFPDAPIQLAEMVADGLLEQQDDRYLVTAMGRLLVRNIAMIFDKYLPELQTKARFSRTV